MRFIKKLLNKYDSKRLYLMKDIYFFIDLENKRIIPFVYNDDYTSALRLDSMKKLENISTLNPKDKYNKELDLIKEKEKGKKSYTSFIYKNEEYEINDVATKLLFAQGKPNMNFLSDTVILNAEELDGRYYLYKRFKSIKKHVYSHEVAYISHQEILDIVDYVINSKKFRKEREKFFNEKNSENSRTF